MALPPAARRELTTSLIGWARLHGRRFPWRQTRIPYRILLAEVLLHRTRAAAVVPVYRRLVGLCPTPSALASEQKRVREIMWPLGLEWRADMLIKATEVVVESYGGEVPTQRKDLLSLPGVGEYIGGAIRCFSSDTPEVLLDTNIVRVLGRYRGLRLGDSARRRREFRELVADLVPSARSREWYFALIDLAATICKPVNPKCPVCPVHRGCAYALGAPTEKLPKLRAQRV
jgi:A/G-specific adenine glycosylase